MKKSLPITAQKRQQLFDEIKQLIKDKNSALIAHFYTNPEIQDLADATGGFVGDSLGMAEFGNKNPAKILIVAGVKFMGETAKILNPEKTVLMPTLSADCSLDFSCPEQEFKKFCKENPTRTVVVYANTSAKIKALSDWVVTSSNALPIIKHLHEQGKKIIWASDRYLGGYIQRKTGADMLIWQGACVIHEKFKAKGIRQLKDIYPDAAVLVHPESPPSVVEMADLVGSTSQLLAASEKLPNEIMIIATDSGIIYKMQQRSPQKKFIIAPTGGNSSGCKSCAKCPWMAMNTLEGIRNCLLENQEEITLAKSTIKKALLPIKKMLDFCCSLN